MRTKIIIRYISYLSGREDYDFMLGEDMPTPQVGDVIQVDYLRNEDSSFIATHVPNVEVVSRKFEYVIRDNHPVLADYLRVVLTVKNRD